MFSTASSDYLEDCDTWMSAQTVNEKFSHYKDFTQFIGGDISLGDVSIEICRKYYRRIQRRVSAKTANNHVKNLKALWNWHRAEDRVQANPWRHVKKNPGEEHQEYIPPTEDVVAVLLAAKSWELDYLNIILKTGGRASDPRRLTWDVVNFEREYLAFWTKKRRGGEKKFRKISMPTGSKLYEILHRIWESRDKHSPFVFTNPKTGTGYTRTEPEARYLLSDRKNNKGEINHLGLCSRAGVKHFTLKSLRHFVALRMADSGKANLIDIQKLLGHEKPTTTDEYLKGLRGDTRKGAAILDDDDLFENINSKESDTRGDTRGRLKRVK
ncbi:MAG: site-specific integrase [Pseudodesulfovibrio sp.]|nr:site-specific integrase [Pseudodesulfovibrio sp.]